MQSDTKIFREVNALSRLSHRNIVRYYTTWVETFEPTSNAHSEDSSTDEGTTEGTNGGMTSVPDHDNASERHLPVNGGFHLNVEDFDDLSVSRSSFPSIHFGRSTSSGEEADSTSSGEDGDDFASLFASSHGKSKSQSQQSMVVIPSGKKKGKFAVPTSPAVSRTLYIQMVRVI
jgi:translation initiation factor 2-alpha kinase 4